MATLEGHESTVWALAFNNSGSQLGKLSFIMEGTRFSLALLS